MLNALPAAPSRRAGRYHLAMGTKRDPYAAIVERVLDPAGIAGIVATTSPISIGRRFGGSRVASELDPTTTDLNYRNGRRHETLWVDRSRGRNKYVQWCKKYQSDVSFVGAVPPPELQHTRALFRALCAELRTRYGPPVAKRSDNHRGWGHVRCDQRTFGARGAPLLFDVSVSFQL